MNQDLRRIVSIGSMQSYSHFKTLISSKTTSLATLSHCWFSNWSTTKPFSLLHYALISAHSTESLSGQQSRGNTRGLSHSITGSEMSTGWWQLLWREVSRARLEGTKEVSPLWVQNLMPGAMLCLGGKTLHLLCAEAGSAFTWQKSY